jgi:hypothetical protein
LEWFYERVDDDILEEHLIIEKAENKTGMIERIYNDTTIYPNGDQEGTDI